MIDLTDIVIDKLSMIQGVVIRSAYDTAVPQFPLITVKQMDNYELIQYTTIDTIERASSIPIQIDCYARNMVIHGEKVKAANAVEYFRQLADEIMQEECGMRRTSAPEIIPHTTDNTIMRAISRYDCIVDLFREIIYKK